MTSPRPLHNKLGAAAVVITLLLGGCGGATTPVRPVEEKAATTGKSEKAAAPAALAPGILSDYTRAINSYKAGDLKTAESILVAMSKAHPELSGPYANLGMIHLKKGEFDNAEVEFNRALTLNPRLPEVYNQLGILYRNKGQFDKALKSYEAGLKLAPDDPNLLINIGILYDLYLNQPDEALKQWQHYRSVVTDDKQVDIWIADINQRTTAKK